MTSEWRDFVADVRASVQSLGEWPKDRGIGPACPCHGARRMKRVATGTYRCTIGKRDFFLSVGSEGVRMLPASRIAGVNP